MDFLDFEKPIVELEKQIDDLRHSASGEDDLLDINDEIKRLEEKSIKLTKKIFGDLNEWQIAQLARHPLRPKSLEVIESTMSSLPVVMSTSPETDTAVPPPPVAWPSSRPQLFQELTIHLAHLLEPSQ